MLENDGSRRWPRHPMLLPLFYTLSHGSSSETNASGGRAQKNEGSGGGGGKGRRRRRRRTKSGSFPPPRETKREEEGCLCGVGWEDEESAGANSEREKKMLRWIYMASAMDKTIQLEISWPCSHHCYTLGLCCECLGGRRERTRAGEGGRGVGAIRRDSPEHGNPPHTHTQSHSVIYFLSFFLYIYTTLPPPIEMGHVVLGDRSG